MTETAADLREKRKGIHARWRVLRAELKALEADLKAFDRVLALVDPAMRGSGAPTARPVIASSGQQLFKHGELAEVTLAALRELGRPATSSEVAVTMLAARGLPGDDPRLPAVSNRVSATLSQWASKGRVERSGVSETGRTIYWQVVEDQPSGS